MKFRENVPKKRCGFTPPCENTDGDFSKSPIKATSEGMVTFGTTVTQGYLDVPVSDFSSLTGRKPLSIQYIFEHVDDYLLGDRHPTE